jgi:hypothetical protein
LTSVKRNTEGGGSGVGQRALGVRAKLPSPFMRPISIVVYSRHSTAACVSASVVGPKCYEDFDRGSADYSIEDVGAVDARPPQAMSPSLLNFSC